MQLLIPGESDNKCDKESNKSTSPSTSDDADKKELSERDHKETSNEETPKLPGVNGYEDDVPDNTTDESRREETVPTIQVERGSEAGGGLNEKGQTDLAADGYRDQDARSDVSDQKSLSSEGSSVVSEVKSESGSVSSEGSSIAPLCEALQSAAHVASGDSSRSATPTNDVSRLAKLCQFCEYSIV